MNPIPLILVLLLGSPGLALASDHAHAHGDPVAHTPTGHEEASTPAQRWAADEPLRRGMRRVHAAAAALSHAEHRPLDPAHVRGVAAELASAVSFMFANCKLAPEPDAALHPLLARVLAASQSLRGGAADAAVIADLRAVLARYPELFEDAGWPAPEVKAGDGH